MTTIADLYARQRMDADPYQSYPVAPQPQQYEQRQPTEDELDMIISDINQDTEEETVKNEVKKKTKYKEDDKLLSFVKEGAILVAIYVIMSGGGIRHFVAGYIPQLNRDDNGKVPIAGLVIYGAIIATLFISLRQYFLINKKS